MDIDPKLLVWCYQKSQSPFSLSGLDGADPARETIWLLGDFARRYRVPASVKSDPHFPALHAGPLALVGRGLHSAPSRLAHHSVLFIFLALSQLNYHAIGQAIGWIHDNAVVLGKTIHDFKF